MKVVSLIRHRAEYPWEAVEWGIRARGHTLVAAPSRWSQEYAVVSWNSYGLGKDLGRACQDAGGVWLVLENGYLRRDAGYVAAGLGGYAGVEKSPGWLSSVGAARFESLGITVLPWHTTPGEYVLVLGQRGGGYSSLAMDSTWPEVVLGQLRKQTSRKLVYRPHPGRAILPGRVPEGTVIDTATSLSELFTKAHTTVVWTSNAATESVLHGVPVRYCGPSIAVKELAIHGLEGIDALPQHPVREPVLHRLAWRQFHIDEWRSGWAWKVMVGDGEL